MSGETCNNCRLHAVVENKLQTIEKNIGKNESKIEELDKRMDSQQSCIDLKPTNTFIKWIVGVFVMFLMAQSGLIIGYVKHSEGVMNKSNIEFTRAVDEIVRSNNIQNDRLTKLETMFEIVINEKYK